MTLTGKAYTYFDVMEFVNAIEQSHITRKDTFQQSLTEKMSRAFLVSFET